MGKVNGKLTVYFDEPFRVGVFERIEEFAIPAGKAPPFAEKLERSQVLAVFSVCAGNIDCAGNCFVFSCFSK